MVIGLRPRGFLARSRGWFLYRAKPVVIKKAGPYPSNPDRRLVCGCCFPKRRFLSANWFAVECPRCGAQAAEEMTPAEVMEVQAEIRQETALHARQFRAPSPPRLRLVKSRSRSPKSPA